MARFLAELQAEYAPWLSWVGVLVGPGGAEDIRRLHQVSPLRFGACLNDRDGSWKAAFRLTSLPAAVFVNEEGYSFGGSTVFGWKMRLASRATSSA